MSLMSQHEINYISEENNYKKDQNTPVFVPKSCVQQVYGEYLFLYEPLLPENKI